jgi:predicted transcriptional regulator
MIEDAWKMVKKGNFSQRPVLDGRERILGWVSESTLLLFCSQQEDKEEEKTFEGRVQDMTGDPFPIVGKGKCLSTLASILGREPTVLVIDMSRTVRIITKYDLIENAFKKKSAVFS